MSQPLTRAQIIQKADMTLDDLKNNGGYLSPEQSDRFLEELIEQPTILQQVRVVAMNSPKVEINKLGFGQRILRAAQDSTALTEAERSKPVTSKITLDSQEVIAEVRLPYRVIEDNIAAGDINAGGDRPSSGFVDMIIRLMAERAATDLEELCIHGDKSNGSDAFLALLDGWLKSSTSHVVDHQNAEVSKTMFKNGVKMLPAKYHRNISAMRHFVSVGQNVEYADKLSSRETAVGDANLQKITGNFGSGVPVSGVPLMPETQGLLTNPKNLIFGIQREISLEYEKLISEREYKIVLTTRIDTKIETEDAVVKYINIKP